MPSVYLDDEEVVDLILERPHLITQAVERLKKQVEEEEESWCTMYATISKLRKRITELENNA